MAQTCIDFADASGYERFMGRWSRAVAADFLRWIEPPRDAKWLDVGCGGGILTEALLDLCEPASVIGVDSSNAQVEQAARGPAGARATFQQADAMNLPFSDGSFDIVASALVINFIPDSLWASRKCSALRRRVAWLPLTSGISHGNSPQADPCARPCERLARKSLPSPALRIRACRHSTRCLPTAGWTRSGPRQSMSRSPMLISRISGMGKRPATAPPQRSSTP